MLRINEYVTTVEKQPYPWHGKIKEIIQNNGIQYFKCFMNDMSGELSIEIYSAKDIRHYSAKEMADDIFSYYTGENAPDIENVYLKEYMDWLQAEIKKQEDGIAEIKQAERTIEDPDYDDFTSAELAAIEHMEEYSVCLIDLKEIIKDEMKEMSVSVSNNQPEEKWLIYVDNNDLTGVDMYQFSGTKKDVRKQIRKLAIKVHNSDKEHYDGASVIEESDDEVLMQVIFFTDCHVEIGARKIKSISNLEE